MAQAYTSPDWSSGEGISPYNLQSISNVLEGIVQGTDKAIHHIEINGSNLVITYVDGTTETFGISEMKGISEVTKASSGNIDTYTMIFTDGTTYSFSITNGKDGKDGADGKDGINTEEAEEVINARTSADGITYTNLKTRIDTEVSELNEDLTQLSESITEIEILNTDYLLRNYFDINGNINSKRDGTQETNKNVMNIRNGREIIINANSSTSYGIGQIVSFEKKDDYKIMFNIKNIGNGTGLRLRVYDLDNYTTPIFQASYTSIGDVDEIIKLDEKQYVICWYVTNGTLPSGAVIENVLITSASLKTNIELDEKINNINSIDNMNIIDDFLGENINNNLTTRPIVERLMIATYNVGLWHNGISLSVNAPFISDIPTKMSNFKKFISKTKADFLLTQECESYIDKNKSKGAFAYLLREKFGVVRCSAPRRIFCAYNDADTSQYGNVEFPILDGTGYTVKYGFGWMITTIKNKKVLIITAHLRNSLVPNPYTSGAIKGPVDDRKNQLIYLFEWIRERKSTWDYCIIGGDFNTSNINGIDANGDYIETDNADWNNLLSIMNHYHFNSASGKYLGWILTFPSMNGVSLDNIIVSDNIRIIDTVCDKNLIGRLYSDHIPMVCELELRDKEASMPTETYT